MGGRRWGPFGPPDRFAGMAARPKRPTEERPTRYGAPGLQATRERAGLSREELGARTGYGAAFVEYMESGGTAHTVTVSRLAAACGEHDLREVRGEGPAGPQVTRAGDIMPGPGPETPETTEGNE